MRPGGFEPLAFGVGVLRLSTKSNVIMIFIVDVHKKRKSNKKPAQPFQHWLCGRLQPWWSNGGQGGHLGWEKGFFGVRRSDQHKILFATYIEKEALRT